MALTSVVLGWSPCDLGRVPTDPDRAQGPILGTGRPFSVRTPLPSKPSSRLWLTSEVFGDVLDGVLPGQEVALTVDLVEDLTGSLVGLLGG